MSGPYAQAAMAYRDVGWPGVLPLPARCKWPPLPGWTGHSGAWPSVADVLAWLDGPQADGNIGLRMPPSVVGIDVDNYGDKQGGKTFADAMALWGTLPPTWRSTNREPGQGSILYYRVPDGLAWPGVLGAGVEIIQSGHRYAVVAPSVHPEGRVYRWVGPDGRDTNDLPRPEELPWLPDTWVAGLTRGELYEDVEHAGLGDQDVADWLAKHGDGEPCKTMARCLSDYPASAFDGTQSRHDTARSASHRIARLAAEGHSGMTVALATIEDTFTSAVQGDPTGPADPYEWRRMLDGAVQLAATEPVAERDPCAPFTTPSADSKDGKASGRTVVLTPASAIKPKPVRWAWDERVPIGEITMTPGRGGVGKSTFHVWMISGLTNGTLPGLYLGQPHACIIAAAEDSWERTIVPRLIAAGANMSIVYRADVTNGDDASLGLSLPADCDGLKVEIRRVGAVLLSVDPLISSVAGGLDTYKDREVREALQPLAQLADQTGCAVLGNAHFGKGQGRDPLSLMMGSVAFGNVARAVLGFAEDGQDHGRVITQVKNNLGRTDLPSLRYTIEPVTVDTDDGPAEVGRLVMLGESERSVHDILREHSDDDQDAAARWLAELLASGRIKSRDVYAAADAAGYSKDQMKRAKKKIGALATHPEIDGPWFWELPLGSARERKGAGDTPPRPSAPLDVDDVSAEAITARLAAQNTNGEPKGEPTAVDACGVCGITELVLFWDEIGEWRCRSHNPLTYTDDHREDETA